MVITLRDILPMDKGNQAYTEYDFGEPVVDYLMDNPEAMLWKVGHIHSHNNMGVFFSGTDHNEIVDNSKFHNFYLSVITNNFFNFAAQIAVRATGVTTLTAKDELGQDYTFSITEAEDTVCIHLCKVSNALETLKPSFLERVAAIIKAAVKVVTPLKPIPPIGFQQQAGKNNFLPPVKNPNPSLFDDIHESQLFSSKSQAYIKQMTNFVTYLLLCGTEKIHESDDLLDVLKGIKKKLSKSRMSIDTFERDIVIRYDTIYFNMFALEDVTDEIYLEDISEVILILQEHKQEFAFLVRIINALEGYREFSKRKVKEKVK